MYHCTSAHTRIVVLEEAVDEGAGGADEVQLACGARGRAAVHAPPHRGLNSSVKLQAAADGGGHSHATQGLRTAIAPALVGLQRGKVHLKGSTGEWR